MQNILLHFLARHEYCNPTIYLNYPETITSNKIDLTESENYSY
jgi:hypothetical protein